MFTQEQIVFIRREARDNGGLGLEGERCAGLPVVVSEQATRSFLYLKGVCNSADSYPFPVPISV